MLVVAKELGQQRALTSRLTVQVRELESSCEQLRVELDLRTLQLRQSEQRAVALSSASTAALVQLLRERDEEILECKRPDQSCLFKSHVCLSIGNRELANRSIQRKSSQADPHESKAAQSVPQTDRSADKEIQRLRKERTAAEKLRMQVLQQMVLGTSDEKKSMDVKATEQDSVLQVLTKAREALLRKRQHKSG